MTTTPLDFTWSGSQNKRRFFSVLSPPVERQDDRLREPGAASQAAHLQQVDLL